MRALIASLMVLTLAPAAAQAQRPPDVQRIESAITELSKQKRAAADQVSANRRAAARALAACRTKGRGWTRIRQVHDRSQRDAYARGARTLWKSLGGVANEGAWVEAYTPAFEHFLRRFDTPLSDPVLQAGVNAQSRRLAYDKAAYSFGNCASFNTELKKVREFKVGGSHGVSGDYYAGKIYNDFVRHVAKRQQAAARSHWGQRDNDAVEAASEQLKALGGNEGYASYFPFAFRG